MKFVNCINCGGVLKEGVCPFCDADYNKARELKIDFEKGDSFMATISHNGKQYRAYLSHMEMEPVAMGAGRDINGRLRHGAVGITRRWEFVQADVDFDEGGE